MVRPAAKRSGLGSKQEAAGSNVFGGSDKDITDKEIAFAPGLIRLSRVEGILINDCAFGDEALECSR